VVAFRSSLVEVEVSVRACSPISSFVSLSEPVSAARTEEELGLVSVDDRRGLGAVAVLELA
jgi:hypothetical protein